MAKTYLDFFREIAAIPHGSGNTKAISDYCVRFAKARGLRCLQDDAGNVIIFKTKRAAESPPILYLPMAFRARCPRACQSPEFLRIRLEMIQSAKETSSRTRSSGYITYKRMFRGKSIIPAVLKNCTTLTKIAMTVLAMPSF